MEEKKTFEDIVSLARRLRAPGGCPWDREQTLESLRAYVLEEAYEVIQAIELEDTDGLVEELGDFLFQAVFISQIASEEGKFDIGDVTQRLHDKLIRRHPHVFGEKKAKDAADALRTWNAEKLKEKKGKPDLEEIPRAMPSLMRAQRVGEKAARSGFDWRDTSSVLAKVKEELLELEREMEAGEGNRSREEWGDLIFSVVNLARHLDIDAETASHGAIEKFIKRFSRFEEKARTSEKEITALSMEQMDEIWEEVKKT
ncbi:MAG: nucleoside triphosphate pyrophosphohydrolase [Candidatus Dadabacteria bacterium]|nr:nucleoside triphosphate pyrophosphohydrolase [Candidatus Dadabacteria bacterium]MYC40861.1 nucleoside triphosphate pyrophosphohydrolase [Candidatus Dadabacteria bacterium]MYH39517.1 nucleoside triphosphate pyrophosphohydrolase [Candidatus Dadabacteria bacterium]